MFLDKIIFFKYRKKQIKTTELNKLLNGCLTNICFIIIFFLYEIHFFVLFVVFTFSLNIHLFFFYFNYDPLILCLMVLEFMKTIPGNVLEIWLNYKCMNI